MGGAVADTLARLGYRVSAWTRRHRKERRPGMTYFHGTQQLQEFAVSTDVLVCLLPLTDETRCGVGGRCCLCPACW